MRLFAYCVTAINDTPDTTLDDLLVTIADDDFQEEDENENHFINVNEEEISYLIRKRYSMNTSRKIVSVRKVFNSRIIEKNRKLRLSLEGVPTKSLKQWEVGEINQWFPVFISEAQISKI